MKHLPEACVYLCYKVEHERTSFTFDKHERPELEGRLVQRVEAKEEVLSPDEDKSAYERKPKEEQPAEDTAKKLKIAKVEVCHFSELCMECGLQLMHALERDIAQSTDACP